jgi:hypothetical protein
MSQGRLARLHYVQLLLVVLAIQGITPDAHDLASSRTLRLFTPLLTDVDSPVEQDEWPDDVCDPVQSATCLPLPHRQDQRSPWTFELAIIQATSHPTQLNSFRCGARRGVVSVHPDRFLSLGRLIC